MLRINDIEIEQKPRKRVKLDTVNYEEYDEFKGDAVELEERTNGEVALEKTNATDQIKGYSMIFESIKKNPKSHRKIQTESTNPNPKQPQPQPQPQSTKKTQPTTQKTKQQSKQKSVPASSNWKAFLQKQKQKPSNKNHKEGHNKNYYQFVAIDCEFVKSGEEECLGRVSLVNQHGLEVYDSFVKPVKKITDFVTEISGITYAHIKNAPNQDHVISEIKKKMLNKIVIGHTVAKDLQICGLKNWTGFKKVIDIAEAHVYSPGGKRVALKKLAFSHLGKVIQEGWHSSSEDANATMQLFLKNKQQILKENKVVKS